MKNRFLLLDRKTDMVSTYSQTQWNMAFFLIFVAGVGFGILLGFIFL